MDNKRKYQIIILIVVIIVSLILVFKLIYFNNKKEKEVNDTTTITTKESTSEVETESKSLSDEEELFKDKPEGVILDGEEVFYEEDTPLNDFFKKQLEWMGADEEGDI